MSRFLCFASLLVTLATLGCASPPPATTGAWVTLIDGPGGLNNWSSIGGGNWRAQDDAIVADDKLSNDDAFLISHNSYKDFQIHAEFWVTSNTNSGIYMRCADARPITDHTCY